MRPPEARKHDYVKSPDGYQKWLQENPERQALEFLPTLNENREKETQRLKKLSKWSAMADALGEVAKVTGASLGRGEMSADGVTPYEGRQTRSFLKRYQQKLQEDEERDFAAQQQNLQHRIRNMDMYYKDKQDQRKQRFTASENDKNRDLRRYQTDKQIESRENINDDNLEFRKSEGKLERDSRSRLKEADLKLRKQLSEMKSTGDNVAAREKARREEWMELKGRESEKIATLSEDHALALYTFLLEKMRESGDISIQNYDLLYSGEKTDPTLIKNIITEFWNKFPETRNYVNEVRKNQIGYSDERVKEILELLPGPEKNNQEYIPDLNFE